MNLFQAEPATPSRAAGELPTAPPRWRPLGTLPDGGMGRVRQLRGGRELAGRLAALGFTPGVRVTVLRRAEGGPLIVDVRDTRVALGRDEAEQVLVQPDDGLTAVAEVATGSATVALVGQPNSGKSTVFNLLTGFSQHVGNWPGKTVEQKTGACRYKDLAFQLVDLPGTYSLTANSIEERIARDFLLQAQPRLAVVILNAAALERHLYLVSELLALPIPLILGLNMMDVAEQQGLHIEAHVLAAALGVPVVPMVASRNRGVPELLQAIERALQPAAVYSPCRPEIRADHKAVLQQLEHLLEGHTPPRYPPDWVALKLLEGDTEITALMRSHLDPAGWAPIHEILKAHEDAVLAIAGGRYEWIERMVRAAVTRPRVGQITLTERLDRAATHPVWGLALLLGIMGLVFGLTFAVGVPLQNLLDIYVVRTAAAGVRALLAGAPWWLSGLLSDGLLAGAGLVFTFLPVLLIFFTVLAVLEDVGYMARVAYVMDRFMHWMGLHGKSFMPLCLGVGCNVPGVLCARTVDSPKARLLTTLLTPLVPCTSRLAVLAVLAPIFFGAAAAWVCVGVVSINILLLLGIGFALHELVLGGEHVAFIMEMPLYHWPNARTIALTVWQHMLEFLRKAGTIIVAMSTVVWGLSFFPSGQMSTSYLAALGHWLAPLGAWMGLDWRMVVALLTSIVAKENALATLGILYETSRQGGGLAAALAGALTPAAALAFLVIQMSFIPCVPTMAAIKQETRSWGWTALSAGILLVASVSVGFSVYQLARWWR